MTLVLTPVTSHRDLKTFIHLPAAIHRHHSKWVPPLYADEWRYFNPRKNQAFAYCDTIRLLARNNGKAVGRIMGIINHRYNNSRGEKTGRFAYWECYEDQGVAHQLLHGVEDWAREKGMNKLVRPLGFGDQDPEGFLVEGFDFEPTLATYYNYEYLIRFLDSAGYAKEVDYVVYKVPVQVPEFYQRIHDRIATRSQFALLEFARRQDLKPYIHPVLRLMNETFQDLYGYVSLDEKEMASLAATTNLKAMPKCGRKWKEPAGMSTSVFESFASSFRNAAARLRRFDRGTRCPVGQDGHCKENRVKKHLIFCRNSSIFML